MARKLSTAEVLPALLVVRPDRRFIEALLLEGHSPAFIERVLGNADLPVPTVAELDSIRSGLPPTPKAFKPRVASHKPSAGYIARLGLLSYFRETPEWQQARAVLAAPRVREVVESGLVLSVPLDQAGHIVRLQLRHHVSPGALALYGAMFLDVSSLARSQLRVVVRERARLAVLRVHGDDAAEEAIARAVEADARVLATTLPSSKLAWGSVLLQLGFQPNRIDLANVIDHVADVAAVRAGTMVRAPVASWVSGRVEHDEREVVGDGQRLEVAGRDPGLRLVPRQHEHARRSRRRVGGERIGQCRELAAHPALHARQLLHHSGDAVGIDDVVAGLPLSLRQRVEAGPQVREELEAKVGDQLPKLHAATSLRWAPQNRERLLEDGDECLGGDGGVGELSELRDEEVHLPPIAASWRRRRGSGRSRRVAPGVRPKRAERRHR